MQFPVNLDTQPFNLKSINLPLSHHGPQPVNLFDRQEWTPNAHDESMNELVLQCGYMNLYHTQISILAYLGLNEIYVWFLLHTNKFRVGR